MAENKPIVVYGNIADPLLALARHSDPISAIQARIDRLLEISSPKREDLSSLSDTERRAYFRQDFIQSAPVDDSRKLLIALDKALPDYEPKTIIQVLEDLRPYLEIAQPQISAKESEIDWSSPRVVNMLIGQVRTEINEQTRNEIFGRQYSDEDTMIAYQTLLKFSIAEAGIFNNVPNPNGTLIALGEPVASVDTPPVLPEEISSIIQGVKDSHAAGMAETEGRASLNPLIPVSGKQLAKGELAPVQ